MPKQPNRALTGEGPFPFSLDDTIAFFNNGRPARLESGERDPRPL